MLETLRRNGFADIAHRLAEEYQDFATLVSLCNKEKIYPPSENPNAELIREYVEKYKEQFTDRLFTWYIQHGISIVCVRLCLAHKVLGEVRVLFEQEGELGPYIQKYFQEHDNLGISWLHHLQREDYEATSVTLLKDAEQSTNLGAKHVGGPILVFISLNAISLVDVEHRKTCLHCPSSTFSVGCQRASA